MTHDNPHLSDGGQCMCIQSCCNRGEYCICPDEKQSACLSEHLPKRTGVILTPEELKALDTFFNEEGDIKEEMYRRLGRKFLVAAVKAGLYDEEDE